MELIERYLNETGRHLPPKNREDILQELRSLIADKLDDRVPEGQPSPTDVVEVLKEMGSPKKIAASFAGERYLIGPALYPMMMQILRIVLAALLVLPVLGLWEMLNTDFASISAILEYALGEVAGYFGAALSAFGMLVLVFAVLERQDVRMDEDEEEAWDPNDLPAIDQRGKVDYVGSSLELSFNFVLIAFLTYFVQQGGIPFFMHPDAPSRIMPISTSLLLTLLIVVALQASLELVVIYRGRWNAVTYLIDGLLDVAGLYYVFAILGQVVTRMGEYLPPLRALVDAGQPAITPVFTLIFIIIVVDHGVKIFRVMNSGGSSANIKASPAKG